MVKITLANMNGCLEMKMTKLNKLMHYIILMDAMVTCTIMINIKSGGFWGKVSIILGIIALSASVVPIIAIFREKQKLK